VTTLSVYEYYVSKLSVSLSNFPGAGYIRVFNGINTIEASGVFAGKTNVMFNVKVTDVGLKRSPVSYSHTVSLRLTIKYDNYPEEVGWRLMNDETGVMVAESNEGAVTSSGIMQRDFHHLRPGYYWFMISDSSYDGICCRNGKNTAPSLSLLQIPLALRFRQALPILPSCWFFSFLPR
jgi:hypothetical protein